MQIDSSLSGASASNGAQVKVFNSQRKQLEAVVGTLLQGIEATPQARDLHPTGQNLNVAA